MDTLRAQGDIVPKERLKAYGPERDDPVNDTVPMIGDLLIVDDNRQNLALLSKILKGKGHRVRLANDGRSALQVIKAKTLRTLMVLSHILVVLTTHMGKSIMQADMT